jgi:hypothetical protein
MRLIANTAALNALKLSSKFNVLSAYEDLEMGKQAKKTFEYLAKHLGADAELNHQMWKFDVLTVPRLREMASQDAANASIIIVASRTGHLPAEVKWWLEIALEGDSKCVALVALVNTPAEFDSARGYLAELARENGLDFFAQPELQPDFGSNLSVDRLHQAEKTFLMLPDPRQVSGYMHFGLNE